VKCIETRPPVYLVIDDHGEIREGTFYVEELQKVINTDDVYKIEPIFKKRKMGQRVQYLVVSQTTAQQGRPQGTVIRFYR
jgi:hypothetical protein